MTTVNTIRNMLKQNTAYAAYGGVLVGVALLGWLMGSLAGGPDKDDPDRIESFTMPSWTQPSLGQQRVDAVAGSLFEIDPDELAAQQSAIEVTDVDAQKGPDYAWRFVGMARQGEDAVAFVMTTKPEKLLTLSINDALPNGEKILSIFSDRLTYSDEAGDHELKLFEKATIPRKDQQ